MQTQAQFGWVGPDPIDILVTNRTGASVAIGDVLELDIRRLNAASTSNSVGIATSGIANAVVPVLTAASDFAWAIFGVAQQAAGDATKLRLRLMGQVDLVTISANVTLATTVLGLIPQASKVALIATPQNTGAAGAVPTKVIFIPLTGGTTSPDGWFDGVRGFGVILQ